jgi:hypothetical protein
MGTSEGGLQTPVNRCRAAKIVALALATSLMSCFAGAQRTPPPPPSSPAAMPAAAPSAPAPSPAPSLTEKQTPAQPSSQENAAISPDENVALAFIRTILTAEKLYKKRHNQYPTALSTLAGTGSVTTRMVKSRERAGYRVGYTSTGENFVLTMTPLKFDDQHRAFYTDSSGVIRAEADKPANSQSPAFKQK